MDRHVGQTSWAESAMDSAWHAVQSPMLGAEQLLGLKPARTEEKHGDLSANLAGGMVGSSALYLGATMLARIALGRYAILAAPFVGGTLGFLEPTEGGAFSRTGHALLGATLNSVAFANAKGLRDSYLPHRAGELVPGEVSTDWVKVDGAYRPFAVRVPAQWDQSKPTAMVVAADSSLIAPKLISPKGYIHGMDDVNGVGAAADRFNTVVMYPMPKARWGGLFHTWNTKDGVVNMFGTRNHDDSKYIAAAMEKTINKANVDRSQVFGFGYDHGGTMLQYQAGVSPPGTFNKISVWSSTVSDRVPLPAEGTGIQVGHSENDPTLGWTGSRGGVAAIPEKFGYNNVALSRPDAQAPRFARANGITGEPVSQQFPDYTARTWDKNGQPIAQEILFPQKFHGVPGRATGGSNESFTSNPKQQGVPPSVSAVDLGFRQWFGLRPGAGAI